MFYNWISLYFPRPMEKSMLFPFHYFMSHLQHLCCLTWSFIWKLHARSKKQVMNRTISCCATAQTWTVFSVGSVISLTPLQAMARDPVRVVNYSSMNVTTEGLCIFYPNAPDLLHHTQTTQNVINNLDIVPRGLELCRLNTKPVTLCTLFRFYWFG